MNEIFNAKSNFTPTQMKLSQIPSELILLSTEQQSEYGRRAQEEAAGAGEGTRSVTRT